jgi:hypothetical protein
MIGASIAASGLFLVPAVGLFILAACRRSPVVTFSGRS